MGVNYEAVSDGEDECCGAVSLLAEVLVLVRLEIELARGLASVLCEMGASGETLRVRALTLKRIASNSQADAHVPHWMHS